MRNVTGGSGAAAPGPRAIYYFALALIGGSVFAALRPWFEGRFQSFIAAMDDRYYGRADCAPVLVVSLAVPACALVADLAARLSARLTRSTPPPLLLLGCETLLLAQGLTFVCGGAMLTATFGAYPRPIVLAALAGFYVAYFLVLVPLGAVGLVLAAAPPIALALAWPGILPARIAYGLAGAVLVVAAAIIKFSGPAARGPRFGPPAAFLIASCLVAGSMFLLVDYGLALGLNVVPHISAWNAGRFTRMERGCQATLALYRSDPVARVFLADVCVQQGKLDQARALIAAIARSGAGGSVGALADKLRMRLDRQAEVKAEVARKPPSPEPGCEAAASVLAEVEELLRRAENPLEMAADTRMIATQFLPAVRAAARASPECAAARRLQARMALLVARQLRMDTKGVVPGEPTPEELEAEAARLVPAPAASASPSPGASPDPGPGAFVIPGAVPPASPAPR